VPSHSRRRLLRRAGEAATLCSLLSLAGCNTPGEGSSNSPSGESPRESSPTDEPVQTPTETAAPRQPVDGSWRSYRSDAANTGSADAPGALDRPTTVWSHATATGRTVGSTAADGVFVAVTESDTAFARNAADGGVQWSRPLPVSPDAPPVAVGGGDEAGRESSAGEESPSDDESSAGEESGADEPTGTVVIAGATELVALSLSTGETRWRRSLAGSPTGVSAVGEDRSLAVVATETALAAVSLVDGTREWRQTFQSATVTGPDTSAELAAVGLADGRLAAVGLDGTDSWETNVTDGDLPSFSPAVTTDGVFVATETGVVALDTDGRRRWRQSPTPRDGSGEGFAVAAAPVVTEEGVIVTALNTEPGATDRRAAETLTERPPQSETDTERAPTETPTPSSDATPTRTPTPLPTDVMQLGVEVTSLALGDGSTRWRQRFPGTYNFTSGPPSQVPTAVVGETVVLGVDDGLTAFDTVTGRQQWRAAVGDTTFAVTDGTAVLGRTAVDATDGTVTWELEGGSGFVGTPAVVGNTVYAGSDDQYLYAVEATTGQVRWSFRADGRIRATPVVDRDGTVYVGTSEGSLYAVDTADGRELWRTEIGGTIQSPTLSDGTLYLGRFDEPLFAVDTDDGSILWQTTPDTDSRFLPQSPAAADGLVYAGANGDLRAFDAADGTQQWRVTADSQPVVQSSPAVADGRVFLNFGSAVRAFDANSGEQLWSVQTGGSNRPPAVRDGVVYTTGENAAYALDAADGTQLWRTPTGRGPSITAAADVVYVLGFDTPLTALDSESGEMLWQSVDRTAETPPAVADDWLFVGAEGGRLFGLTATDD
jgi:outer membrane protein assembly factor BamB